MTTYLIFLPLSILVYMLFNVDLDGIKYRKKWTYGDKINELLKDEEVSFSYLDSLIKNARYVDSLNVIQNYLYSSRAANLTKNEFDSLTYKAKRKEEDLIFNEYKQKIIKQYKTKVARG